MAPTLLGVAANHNFIAKFEAALCPMIKFIVSGTCLMSIWTPERLLEKTPRSKQKMDTVKLSQFVVDATEDDVQQAAEQEEFFLSGRATSCMYLLAVFQACRLGCGILCSFCSSSLLRPFL